MPVQIDSESYIFIGREFLKQKQTKAHYTMIPDPIIIRFCPIQKLTFNLAKKKETILNDRKTKIWFLL